MKTVHGNIIEKFRSGDPNNRYEKRLDEIKELERAGKIRVLRYGSTRGRWGWDLVIIYRETNEGNSLNIEKAKGEVK